MRPPGTLVSPATHMLRSHGLFADPERVDITSTMGFGPSAEVAGERHASGPGCGFELHATGGGLRGCMCMCMCMCMDMGSLLTVF